MNSLHLIRKTLPEIADVERTQKNKIYPKDTIYVQVSACRKGTEQIWNLTKHEGTLEDKYAVVIPKIEIVPRYLVIALENITLEWMHRYVGRSINISMDLFKYLEVAYHPDIREQYMVLAVLNPIQAEIDELENRIDFEKKAKGWFLEKMIANLQAAPGTVSA